MKVEKYVPSRCRGVNLQVIFNEVHGEATVILTATEYVKGQRYARPLVVEHRVPTQVPETVTAIWEALAELVLNQTLPLSGD